EHVFCKFCCFRQPKTKQLSERIFKAVILKFFPRKNEILFIFEGNAFLYNQIRIMVGVLLEIGNKTRPVHDICRLIEAKDRQQARFTAPASGLYLDEVNYESVD
ncbi:hypothetical protein Q757_05420, partial [Oenococcus alcoholitolerans]